MPSVSLSRYLSSAGAFLVLLAGSVSSFTRGGMQVNRPTRTTMSMVGERKTAAILGASG